jgi:general secretion pathway protein D
VMIEAIIVEIGDDAAKRLGVQFLIGSTKVGFAGTNYSNAQPNILTLAGAIAATRLNERTTTVINPNGSTTTTTETENTELASELQKGAVTALQNATGGFGGIATQLGQNGVFGAILNAVQSDTKSSILSTPSITTLDNMKAHMLVGQEIPITTGQALSSNFDNQFRTVQRENVGIILDVTPQVSGNGQVKLLSPRSPDPSRVPTAISCSTNASSRRPCWSIMEKSTPSAVCSTRMSDGPSRSCRCSAISR